MRDMRLTRRAVLGAAAAVLAPAIARALPRDPDVVVIGAGAAGIGAATELVRLGRQVLVLEAAPRLGGRAHTDSGTFGVPFDTGAAFAHAVPRNPLAQIATANGVRLIPYDARPHALFSGRRAAGPADIQAFEAATAALETALDASTGDAAAAALLPAPKPAGWERTAQLLAGPLDAGVDLDALSAADWRTLDTAPSSLVATGYGALLAQTAQGLPVRTGVAVTKVVWGGDRVVLETSAGAIAAASVVVTVSTGVLQDGLLFEPALPDWKRDAIAAVPMGCLIKIALGFDPADPLMAAAGEDSWIVQQALTEQSFAWMWRPAGRPLAVALAGGRFAWELSRADPAEAIAFAREDLARTLGSDAAARVTAALVTDWGRNPLTRGAWSAAKPGEAHKRRLLGEPVGGRVFFAGEACAGRDAGTVHGAWTSGREAARAAAGAV